MRVRSCTQLLHGRFQGEAEEHCEVGGAARRSGGLKCGFHGRQYGTGLPAKLLQRARSTQGNVVAVARKCGGEYLECSRVAV